MLTDAQTTPSAQREGLLIVGLGNLLMRDEGVGVHVVCRLRDAFRWGPGVTLLDGGTAGIALLDEVAQADEVWCIDAAKLDAHPGAMRWLGDEHVDASLGSGVSMHQLNMADVLGYLELMDAMPRKVDLLAIVPERVETGTTLTPVLDATCRRAASAIAARARDAGFEVDFSRATS